MPASAQEGVSGNILINRGANTTNNPEKKVSLTVQSRNAKFMMISNNGSFIGAQWQRYEPYVGNWKLAGEDGRKTVYAQFKDAYGNLSESVSAEISLDRIAPSNPSITINDGRDFTSDKNRVVRLDIDALDAFQMRVSNRRDFLGATWVSFRKRIGAWRLTALPGVKQVFVQFRDRAGNTSDVIFDEINLDYQPPNQCRMTIENGEIYTNKKEVTIKMEADGATEMIFRGGEGWIPYAPTTTFLLSDGDGEKEIVGKFRDEAGNQSVVVYDKIILDTQPPTNGIIVINDRAKYTKGFTNLHLKIFALGATEMLVSNNEDFKGARWQPFAQVINSWEVSGENGTKSVYVKFRDKAGNESEVYADEIELDDTPPSNPYIEIVAEDAVYDSLERARIIKNDAHVIDLKIAAENADYMMVSNTNTFYGNAWIPYAETLEKWELGGDNDGSRHVFVKFRDKAGNISQVATDRVIVDTEAPLDCRIHIEGSDIEDIYATDTAGIVEVKLFARKATEMMLANDSTFENALWKPYETETYWKLSEGDGKKIVYAKFRDLVGNESKYISEDILLDRKPPFNCFITLNKGAAATNNIDKVVLLKVKAEDAVTMQISNTQDFDGLRWIGYSELNINWGLAGDDGQKVVRVRFRDLAGNISEVYSDSILLDRTPPIQGTVAINDGEKITNNSNKKIMLALHAENVTEMRVANTYDFKEAAWEPYAEQKEWLLTGPDGMKTVFVQYRDSLGNISRTCLDKIGVDRQAPEGGKVVINQGATYCTDIDKRVNLKLIVRDADFMMVSNDPTFTGVTWQQYEPFMQYWTLDGDDGDKTVYVKYKDIAGNEVTANSSIKLDRQEPINESLVINGGASYTNDKLQVVQLKIHAEGAQDMIVGDDKFFRHPAKWQPYKADMTWTLKGRDGQKYVYVKFRDEAGNETAPVQAGILLDTEPPIPRSVKINGAKTGTESRVVTLTIDAKHAKYMMVSESAKFDGAEWENYAPSHSWTLSGNPGLKRIFVKFKDDAENVSGHVFGDITLFGEE